MPTPPREKATKTLGVAAPSATESFNGTASGVYSPLTSPPPSICAYFWKNVPDGTNPALPADVNGVVTVDTPLPGMWKATFTFPPGQSGTHGYLRIVKSNDQANAQNIADLTWPASTVSSEFRHDIKHNRDAPQIIIQSPPNPAEVPRLFLVYGEFNPKDGYTVSVRLLRIDGTDAVATILPPEYPHGHHWVTTILTYEGGLGYSVHARLLDADGTPISVPNSVGLAID